MLARLLALEAEVSRLREGPRLRAFFHETTGLDKERHLQQVRDGLRSPPTVETQKTRVQSHVLDAYLVSLPCLGSEGVQCLQSQALKARDATASHLCAGHRSQILHVRLDPGPEERGGAVTERGEAKPERSKNETGAGRFG